MTWPPLEQLKKELHEYVKCLTNIHHNQVKGATDGRTAEVNEKTVVPGLR